MYPITQDEKEIFYPLQKGIRYNIEIFFNDFEGTPNNHRWCCSPVINGNTQS